jgi:hypothetical protein
MVPSLRLRDASGTRLFTTNSPELKTDFTGLHHLRQGHPLRMAFFFDGIVFR